MKYNILEYGIANQTLTATATYDKPVIGLDRDGVINFTKGKNTYVYKSEDFIPIPGSLEAISIIRNKKYKIVIITNQGGIFEGKYTKYDVEKLHNYMFELLGKAGCMSIDGIYYTESLIKKDIFVKPNTGMFKRAEKEISGIKFSEGYYVGDSIEDVKVANKVNAKPILVRTGNGIDCEKELNKFTYKNILKKVVIFDNLLQFANYLK